MNITPSFIKKLEENIPSFPDNAATIREVRPVHGGDINEAFELRTASADYFLKVNRAAPYPGLFEKEYHGLEHLRRRKGKALFIPAPLACGTWEDQQFLLMEFFHAAPAAGDFWEVFGREMALLHRHHEDNFGFAEDNYLGTVLQSNRHHADWSSFYIEERLDPLFRKLHDEGSLEAPFLKRVEFLYRQLPQIFPSEPPSLLHGDLWSGNFSIGPEGQPCIYDPAVYYGHREMDLAMTRLFGGFDYRFYSSYESEWPLEAGWQSRISICQLYPLLVHALLFGGHYVLSVKDLLKGF